MGGIISGFLGGAAKGMADAGKLMFADKLAKEREEANFLRDSALKKTLQTDSQKFRSTEAETDRTYKSSEAEIERKFTATESTKKDKAALERSNVQADAKSGSNKPTNKSKNIDDLVRRGLSQEEAIIKVYPGSIIKHTDVEGNISVAIPDGVGKDGKPKYRNILSTKTDKNGTSRWYNEGEEPEKKITNKEKKVKAKEINEKEDNNWPWTKTGYKDPSVTKAIEEERKAKKGGGIVGSKITKQTSSEMKTVGKNKMSKEDFIARMVKQHGESKRKEIEDTWKKL